MNVTTIEKEPFAKCKSFKDGERCRFFKGWEPLRPGFKPDPRDPGFKPGGDAEEIHPPDRLLNMREQAHYVYRVFGEDVPDYEYVVVGVMREKRDGKKLAIPYAWFSQSDTFMQGEKALERVGIDVENDLEHAYADAVNSIDAAVLEYSKYWPEHRIVLAFDDGTGLRCAGNAPDLMNAIHAAETARKAEQSQQTPEDNPDGQGAD